MNPSFSVVNIPSLEALESDSDSVFSISRHTLTSENSTLRASAHSGESTPSSPLSVEEYNYIIYKDFEAFEGPSPIRQDDKVFFTVREPEQEPVPLPPYEIIKLEELHLSTIADPRRGKSDLYPDPACRDVELRSDSKTQETTPPQDSKKRKRLPPQTAKSSRRQIKEEDEDASPFPEYYNLSKEEISFFKKIKLIQSSSSIRPIQDNMHMIEVTHHDKSIEHIRCFRSSIDHLMYFCSVDVFYPILRLKENINREVKARASPENYHLIEIQNKKKTLTFLNFYGFVEVIRYRMDPLSAANTGILDLVKCNELSLELQKYL